MSTPDDWGILAERLNGRLDLFQFQLEQVRVELQHVNTNAAGFAGKVDVAALELTVERMEAEFNSFKPTFAELTRRYNEARETKLGTWRLALGVIVTAVLSVIGAALLTHFGIAP